MIEMKVQELQRSKVTPFNVVILEEKDGDRAFPIFIGTEEAYATENALYERQTPRPLTHDLIVNVVAGLDATLEGVLVDELDNDTFYGKLLLKTSDGRHVKIDSRPSDAIVLATKLGLPIFVSDDVLNSANIN